MNNTMYQSMTAAEQLLEKQNIISNNLANISTTGFKEKFIFLVKNYNLDKTNNNILTEYYNTSPGMLNYTNRKLDLFIKDNGWLVVKDANGKEGYTRNGHLIINKYGKLTIQNHEVIGNNGDIKIPKNININILSDGTIQAIIHNKNHIVKKTISTLKLVNLPSHDILQKENGLFYIKDDSNLNKDHIIKHNNKIRVQSGILESSNVNSVQNMIEMISNARQFDMQMKMISTCDHNAEYANQLININN